MKIVQSLWSKPGRQDNPAEYNKCGWGNRKYNYFSWALSALQFREYYDTLELVTDRAGYELLIEKMELPYTDVKVVLDEINHFHEDLFIAGKIYAYSLQNEPFIHADADVFVWKRFDETLERSSLICQSREEGPAYNKYYSEIFYPMIRGLDFYPEMLMDAILKNKGIRASNMGITGGHNIAFFKNYCAEVFDFIDRNTGCFDKFNVKHSNPIFEQFLFRAMADKNGDKITYLNPAVYGFLSELVDFTGVPGQRNYIHFNGEYKRLKHLEDCLEYRLQKDHPAYYYRIMNLLRTNQI